MHSPTVTGLKSAHSLQPKRRRIHNAACCNSGRIHDHSTAACSDTKEAANSHLKWVANGAEVVGSGEVLSVFFNFTRRFIHTVLKRVRRALESFQVSADAVQFVQPFGQLAVHLHNDFKNKFSRIVNLFGFNRFWSLTRNLCPNLHGTFTLHANKWNRFFFQTTRRGLWMIRAEHEPLQTLIRFSQHM